jgi:hypothetical protein
MFKFAIALVTTFSLTMGFCAANPMRPDNIRQSQRITPVVVTQPKTVTFNLSDISITGDLRYAYINQQRLTLNESISGYRIIEIESNYVFLKKGDSGKKLYLITPGSFTIVPSTEDSQSE